MGRIHYLFLELIFLYFSSSKEIKPEINFYNQTIPNIFSYGVSQTLNVAEILDAKKIDNNKMAFLSSYTKPCSSAVSTQINQLLHITIIEEQSAGNSGLVISNHWNVKLGNIVGPIGDTQYTFYEAKIIDAPNDFLIFVNLKGSNNK